MVFRSAITSKAYEPYLSGFTQPTEQMSRRTADRACTHFIAAIPGRIICLRTFLQREYGFQLDMSRAAYTKAFGLVSGEFGKRQLSETERRELVAEIPAASRKDLEREIDYEDLDFFTLGLCIDFAMLFGEVLISEDSHLTWGLSRQKKGMFDYQRPVVRSALTTMELNAVQVVKVLCFASLEQPDLEPEVLWLFHNWSLALSTGMPLGMNDKRRYIASLSKAPPIGGC